MELDNNGKNGDMEIEMTRKNNDIFIKQHPKKKNVFASDTIDTQVKYLAGLILSLENRQAAESIKCILETRKFDEDDGINN